VLEAGSDISFAKLPSNRTVTAGSRPLIDYTIPRFCRGKLVIFRLHFSTLSSYSSFHRAHYHASLPFRSMYFRASEGVIRLLRCHGNNSSYASLRRVLAKGWAE